jgi:hypothetical protein
LICYDINPEAIALTKSFLNFEDSYLEQINESLEEHQVKTNKW